jgi:hypothetical protein
MRVRGGAAGWVVGGVILSGEETPNSKRVHVDCVLALELGWGVRFGPF